MKLLGVFTKSYCFVLGILLSWFVAAQNTTTPQRGAYTAASLIVLKNMNVLSGVARADFEKTIVEQPNGSRIILPTDQVALICDTYQEIFDFFSSQLEPEDYAGVERLCRWCIRYQQFEAAQRLIDRWQFSRMNPQVLESLHTQLVTSRAAYERSQKSAALETSNAASSTSVAATTTTPDAASRIETTTREVLPDAMVQLAGFSSEPSPVLTNGAEATIPGWELDAKLKNMPELGLAGFKRVVEPILAKNCATVGCHHRTSDVYPILTVASGVTIPKRMSQQNIYQALRYLDPDQPDASPLLKFAITAHGRQAKPAIDLESREHQILAEWVNLMAEPAKRAEIPRIMVTAARADVAAAAASAISSSAEEDVPTKPAPHTASEPPPNIPNLTSQRKGGAVEDPFDPQIFNREFSKKRATAERSENELGSRDQ